MEKANWTVAEIPPSFGPPRPLSVRALDIPPRHTFPEHSHAWNQVVYATSGVLTLAVEARTFVISPEQAVWIPTGVPHRVGSLHGAATRSLWIANDTVSNLPDLPTVFEVSSLLQALIDEATELTHTTDAHLDMPYLQLVTTLIIEQLCRSRRASVALPWPSSSSSLTALCEALYQDPSNTLTPAEWGRHLGMSERTLTRRFKDEVGMSLRSWRRRMRLFKAIELLGGGLDVTGTALELGYGSTSAFVYAFRTDMGASPMVYMKGQKQGRGGAG